MTINSPQVFPQAGHITLKEREALLGQSGMTIWLTGLSAAFISPTIADREMARQIIGSDRYHEVFISTSVEACESRDPKGLYCKARKGEIPEFTGISSPYEPPINPDLIINTEQMDFDEAVQQLIQLVKLRNCTCED